MVSWLRERLDDYARGKGQPGPRFHCRWMGRPAASGRRQMLFMFDSAAVAASGLELLWDLWVPVPASADSRGWRMASVRFFR